MISGREREREREKYKGDDDNETTFESVSEKHGRNDSRHEELRSKTTNDSAGIQSCEESAHGPKLLVKRTLTGGDDESGDDVFREPGELSRTALSLRRDVWERERDWGGGGGGGGGATRQ